MTLLLLLLASATMFALCCIGAWTVVGWVIQ